MSSVKRFDETLNRDRSLDLIQFIGNGMHGKTASGVIRDFAALHNVPKFRVRNSLVLFSELGIIRFRDEQVIRNEPLPENVDALAELIAKSFIDFIFIHFDQKSISRSASYQIAEDRVVINSFTLPGYSTGLMYPLLQFQILRRNRFSDRLCRVSSPYKEAFLAAIQSYNRSLTVGSKLSPVALEALLRKQAELGRSAEEWVYRYERQRLKDHPMVEDIRMVSKEDVRAGFDIISFSKLSSLRHDRFIEVKSYNKDLTFHWSVNEVQKAMELGEEYFLYLIDRSQIDQEGYHPKTIQGPYTYFFESDVPGWSRECGEYVISQETIL